MPTSSHDKTGSGPDHDKQHGRDPQSRGGTDTPSLGGNATTNLTNSSSKKPSVLTSGSLNHFREHRAPGSLPTSPPGGALSTRTALGGKSYMDSPTSDVSTSSMLDEVTELPSKLNLHTRARTPITSSLSEVSLTSLISPTNTSGNPHEPRLTRRKSGTELPQLSTSTSTTSGKRSSASDMSDSYFSLRRTSHSAAPTDGAFPSRKFDQFSTEGLSPMRPLTSAYAPVRTPSQTTPGIGGPGVGTSSNGPTSAHSNSNPSTLPPSLSQTNSSVSTSSSNAIRNGISAQASAQAQYFAQEKAYLQKIRNDADESSAFGIGGSPITVSEVDFSDNEGEDTPVPINLGTNFDEDYTDDLLVSSYPLLDVVYDKDLGSVSDHKLDVSKERLEWQAMLASVLTGEVFRSEKRRIKPLENDKGVDAEQMWVALRARVCGRTILEQQRVLDYSRSTVGDALQKIAAFRINSPSSVPLGEADKQVSKIIDLMGRCESLFRNLEAMKKEYPLYASAQFQRRLNAMISWKNISASIDEEVELLRQWTGNTDLDPTRPPDNTPDGVPLVDSITKQSQVREIFEVRIQSRIGPLIEKARGATVEFSDVFIELGLPPFQQRLLNLIMFPIKLSRSIIDMGLSYARRLVNPTLVIIDQLSLDFQMYIELALDVVVRNENLTAPILDKGWMFPDLIDDSFKSTVVDCVNYYIELLHKKFLEDGRNFRGLFRAFKETDHLAAHYGFLLGVGRLSIEADNLVAEQITSLSVKLVSKLLAYWEHQAKGPTTWVQADIERWFGLTMENIRGFYRKFLRFAKIITTSYENAAEYHIHPTNVKEVMDLLRGTGHFLVYTGTFEKYGIYALGSTWLKERPDLIRQLFTGYSRLTDESKDTGHPAHIMIFCIEEPLVWQGEIYNLDIPYSDLDIKPGRIRLISEGGTVELEQVKNEIHAMTGGAFDQTAEMVIKNRSQLIKVDAELNKLRKMIFRISSVILSNTPMLRRKISPYNCHETSHNLFVFAREFGQMSIGAMEKSRRSITAIKLINLCIEWVAFICEDCRASDSRAFRWTVAALEFAMMMTRGINIVAISHEQFENLRRKVSDCMILLISHFDVIGRTTRAAAPRAIVSKKASQVAVKDDDELIGMLREETIKKVHKLEEERQSKHAVGKVLDDSNKDTEILKYLASSFSNVQIRWQQGRFIGGGAFGSVYAAVNLDTGGVMAVKEIRLQDPQSIRHILKSIKDEMTVLEILSHPNIVRYYGVEVHRDRVFIFMEYCEGGSLAGLLEYGRIEEEQIVQVYTLQMLEGIAYLHQSGIVHRDIKPENILLDHLGVIKFVDFGAAKVIARTGATRRGGGGTIGSKVEARTRLNSMTGTPMYMAPEAITGANPGNSEGIDIWSLGCCVLEMCTGRRPWANLDNEWAIMYHIAAGHLPQLPSKEQLSPAGQKFLMRCLEKDPKKRPSAVELLKDPWIMEIRNLVLASIPPDEPEPAQS